MSGNKSDNIWLYDTLVTIFDTYMYIVSILTRKVANPYNLHSVPRLSKWNAIITLWEDVSKYDDTLLYIFLLRYYMMRPCYNMKILYHYMKILVIILWNYLENSTSFYVTSTLTSWHFNSLKFFFHKNPIGAKLYKP